MFSAWGHRLHVHFQLCGIFREVVFGFVCHVAHQNMWNKSQSQLTITEKKMSEIWICTCYFTPPSRVTGSITGSNWSTHSTCLNTQSVLKDCTIHSIFVSTLDNYCPSICLLLSVWLRLIFQYFFSTYRHFTCIK